MFTWAKVVLLSAVILLIVGCISDGLTPPQVFSEGWADQKTPQRQKRKPIVLMGDEENPSAMVFQDDSGRTRVGIGGEKLSAGVGNRQLDVRYQVPLGKKTERLPEIESAP